MSEFKIGDKAILNKDAFFVQISGDYEYVNAGTEVEIVEVSNSDDATEKEYKVKYQHSTATVLGRKLDKMDYKFKVGDIAILKNDTSFNQGDGVCLISAGTEVEIVSVSDYINNTDKLYGVRYQNGTSVVRGYDLIPVSKNITDRIKTFYDAVDWCNENSYDVYTSAYNVCVDDMGNDDRVKDIIAYLKLRIITAALNEGWKPTFEEDEERWRVVYEAMDDSYDSGCSLKWETTPNKLILKSEKLAKYVATQFADIYADFCGCKKGGEECQTSTGYFKILRR